LRVLNAVQSMSTSERPKGSCIANHLGAPFAVIDVGPYLDHAAGASIIR
jgi:hypothetical protein